MEITIKKNVGCFKGSLLPSKVWEIAEGKDFGVLFLSWVIGFSFKRQQTSLQGGNI